MQLPRKTLQTTLSVTKLKVMPSDRPFKKSTWFWQNINFQIALCKQSSASMVDMDAKTVKDCLQHLNVPCAKWVVGTVT